MRFYVFHFPVTIVNMKYCIYCDRSLLFCKDESFYSKQTTIIKMHLKHHQAILKSLLQMVLGKSCFFGRSFFFLTDFQKEEVIQFVSLYTYIYVSSYFFEEWSDFDIYSRLPLNRPPFNRISALTGRNSFK